MQPFELCLLTTGSLAVAAVFFDLAQGRIPNGFTVSSAVAGLVFNMLTQGTMAGARTTVGGLALGLALTILPFALGGMGGGDVKLLACIGAWVGPLRIFSIFVYGSLIGAGACLYLLIRADRLGALKRVSVDVSLLLRVRGKLEPQTDRPTIPYSLPIAAGTGLAAFLGDCLRWP